MGASTLRVPPQKLSAISDWRALSVTAGSPSLRRSLKLVNPNWFSKIFWLTSIAFDFVPDRPGHDLRYATDTTKIRAELGWQPAYGDFTAGLAATIGWYRDNERGWKPHKDPAAARYRALGR